MFRIIHKSLSSKIRDLHFIDFTRPMKIHLLHENTESSVNETDCNKHQENKLISFNTVTEREEIVVNYELV